MVQKLIQQKEVSLIKEGVERAWTGQAGEEKAQGNLTKVYIYMMEEGEEERTRLSSVVPSDRTRGNGHKIQTHKIISDFFFFPLMVVKHTSVEQVAQRDCRETPNQSRHSPGQPLLADPASTMVVGQDYLKRSLPT